MLTPYSNIISVQTSCFTGILDTYPNAAAAYSVRRLATAYTGPLIRVRRSSDNAEQNIGYTGAGDLDESALTTFVGANNAYVTTWYDQSGSANHATQTNAARQPQIVNAGTVVKVNNKSAMTFPSVGLSFFSLTSSITSNSDALYYFVAERDNLNKILTGLSTSGLIGFYSNNVAYVIGKEFYFGNPNTNLGQMLFLTTMNVADYDLFINDVNTSITLNYTYNAIFQYISNYYFEGQSGKFQEIILWNIDKTSDKAGITTNVNTYYGIF